MMHRKASNVAAATASDTFLSSPQQESSFTSSLYNSGSASLGEERQWFIEGAGAIAPGAEQG